MSDWIPTGLAKAIEEENRAACERGLRRGLAIALEHEIADPHSTDNAPFISWTDAFSQMEREIEEAKR